MDSQLSADKFQEPFDVTGFVERASRAGGVSYSRLEDEFEFDTAPIIEAFDNTIDSLMVLYENVTAEVAVLEGNCAKKEQNYKNASESMQETVKEAAQSLQTLSESINRVATKIVHVGDQLESINGRRLRAEEAEKLLQHFEAFHNSDLLLDPFENITPENLPEAAEIIRHLQTIAVELPYDNYKAVKSRIDRCFDDIEQRLLHEFNSASADIGLMRKYAFLSSLYPFKSFNSLVTSFITMTINREHPDGPTGDVFAGMKITIKKTGEQVNKIFQNPGPIMALFIEEIMMTLLVNEISRNMKFGTPLYLQQLCHYHRRTKELLEEVTQPYDSLDSHYRDKMLDYIFQEHIETYMSQEEELMCENYDKFLDQFYESIKHIRQYRKPGAKFEPFVHDPMETFISVDAASMIADNKSAIERCKELSVISEVPEHVFRLFLKLLDYLCVQHIDYAIAIAIEELPLRKPKTEPSLLFFSVLRDANNLFYLLQKHFWDVVLPAVKPSLLIYPKCVNKKNEVMERLESQLSVGVERLLESLLDWTKTILTRDQKKTDFKPDDTTKLDYISTTLACQSCIAFLEKCVKTIQKCLNGKNLEYFLKDFGIQFHRVLLDHIRAQVVSIEGGLSLSCDLNEYCKRAVLFNDKLVIDMFETLRELGALLLVKPENIKSLCEEGRLASIDQQSLQSFLQLRVDYKTNVMPFFFKST